MPDMAEALDITAKDIIHRKRSDLRTAVAEFATPNSFASALQFASSLGLFLIACAAMHWAYSSSYLLTLALCVLAGGLLVRLFIIQHDCGHGAFFRSARANDIIGRLCSLFTWTPYANWRRQHAQHHGVWNNLDRRQSGTDIYSSCLTVREYLALPRWRQRLYRVCSPSAGRQPVAAAACLHAALPRALRYATHLVAGTTLGLGDQLGDRPPLHRWAACCSACARCFWSRCRS